MILLTKLYRDNDISCDYVKCPVCQRRLCDKPIGEKATVLEVNEESRNIPRNGKLILKCSKCSSKYLISIGSDDI